MKKLFILSTVICCISHSSSAQNTIPAYGNNAQAGNYANVNGIRMYYETYGEGKPLLLIHGNGDAIDSLRKQIIFFSQHFKVIVADSRGHGKSIDNGDSLTYDGIADDINVLLDQLHIDSAYIFGQSDGAIIGLIMAIRYPKKVKMLAAMAPNTRPDSAIIYPEAMIRMQNAFLRLTDSVKQGYKEKNARLKLLRLMLYHPHISPMQLASIQAPVLIMSGDRDIILLSHVIEIFRAIPKSQLCVLPGSTHFALRQNAAVFNETIQRFFSKPFEMPKSL